MCVDDVAGSFCPALPALQPSATTQPPCGLRKVLSHVALFHDPPASEEAADVGLSLRIAPLGGGQEPGIRAWQTLPATSSTRMLNLRL